MYGCAMNSANDEQFSALSSMRGQPAEAPGLLAGLKLLLIFPIELAIQLFTKPEIYDLLSFIRLIQKSMLMQPVF